MPFIATLQRRHKSPTHLQTASTMPSVLGKRARAAESSKGRQQNVYTATPFSDACQTNPPSLLASRAEPRSPLSTTRMSTHFLPKMDEVKLSMMAWTWMGWTLQYLVQSHCRKSNVIWVGEESRCFPEEPMARASLTENHPVRPAFFDDRLVA